MKHSLIIILLLISNVMNGQIKMDKELINSSRGSCIKIISKQGNSSGTGFFIGNDVLITCFHVIAKISVDSSSMINFNIYPDLEGINENGDTITLTCISIPTNTSPDPLFQDFAVLKANRIIANQKIIPLCSELKLEIADIVLFSGYPLGTPTMVTHFGNISGITKDSSIICIQASTNKGNSGGALINNDGKVIGIVSMREGGISQGLQNYMNKINETEKHGSVQLMGIDPLQATKETISVLDTYISTGIGYARSIKFVDSYIKKMKIKI